MPRSLLPALAALLTSALSPCVASSTDTRAAAPDDSLEWSPPRPRQGTIFRVILRGARDEAPNGSIGPADRAEPLHFERGPGDVWVALAPVPVDAADSIEVRVEARFAGRPALVRRIPLSAGEYAMERLRVAPRFGREPDSATRARMAREARRAHAVATAAHETPRLWHDAFVRPRPSRITSGFGGGREFNGTVTSRHMGTDFAGAVGAPVRAVNRGVVRLVDRFYLGGNVIYIDHGAGVTTAYLHLSRQLVAVGDTVRAGQVIGHVGATGRVTGPHLHLIARYGQVTVDPLSLLELESLADDSTP